MSEHNPRSPGRIMTFIIRDDSPFIHMQEPVTCRSVQVTLTPEQQQAIAVRCTGTIAGRPIYEEVRECFLEPEDNP